MEESVHVYRSLINHEELFSHYETQNILPRLITPSQLRVSLVYTMRKFDHSALDETLLRDYYILPPATSGVHSPAQSPASPVTQSTLKFNGQFPAPKDRKHGARRHVTYGFNRVLALELTSPSLSLRQSKLAPLGLTFFEIEDYKPHIVLDFNLSPLVETNELTSLQTPDFPLYFHSETLVPATTSIRSSTTYRSFT